MTQREGVKTTPGRSGGRSKTTRVGAFGAAHGSVRAFGAAHGSVRAFGAAHG